MPDVLQHLCQSQRQTQDQEDEEKALPGMDNDGEPGAAVAPGGECCSGFVVELTSELFSGTKPVEVSVVISLPLFIGEPSAGGEEQNNR